VEKEITRHTKEKANYRQSTKLETNVSMFANDLPSNTFTIYRDLEKTEHDIRYRKTEYGLMKPYIDKDEIAFNWYLAPE